MITLLLVFVLCVCFFAWLEIRSKKHNESKEKWVKSMMEELRELENEEDDDRDTLDNLL